MMAYNTQNYWGFGLYPSSGILKTREHATASSNIRRNWTREMAACGKTTYGTAVPVKGKCKGKVVLVPN
jgi:hypothetical protein